MYKNNVNINALFVKKEKIYPTYVWKHNSNHEKQVILSMTANGEGWHYLVVKTLLALKALSCSKKIISIIKGNNIKK